METITIWSSLRPSVLFARISKRMAHMEDTLERMEYNMATLLEVVNEVRDAVLARIDREIAKGQEAIAAKQAELDALIVAEDAEDVEQAAQIAVLQAQIEDQTAAKAALDEIKAGVNADVAVVDVEQPIEEPVVEEPVAEEPAVEEPVAEEPAVEEPVVEEPVVTDETTVV